MQVVGCLQCCCLWKEAQAILLHQIRMVLFCLVHLLGYHHWFFPRATHTLWSSVSPSLFCIFISINIVTYPNSNCSFFPYITSFLHDSLERGTHINQQKGPQTSLYGHWFLLAGKEDMISGIWYLGCNLESDSGRWMNTGKGDYSSNNIGNHPRGKTSTRIFLNSQICIEISTYRCSDCRCQRATAEASLSLKGPTN